MDWTTVYAKTAKGVMELTGKTKRLPRDLARVLQLVDGKVSMAEMLTLSSKLSEMKLNQSLDILRADGYVKVLMSARHSQFAEDLGFPATIGVSVVNTQVFLDAQEAALGRTKEMTDKQQWNEELVNLKHELDDELQREADKIARVAIETRAKEEAAKKANQAVERIKLEQAEQAQREVESRAAENASAKARLAEKLKEEAERKARADADALAEQQAASRAKAEEAERLRIEAESRARVEAEKKQRLAAKAREEADKKAKIAAAEQAQREVEIHAQIVEDARRKEALAKAKAGEEMRLREEAISKAEAEQQAFESAQEKENERLRAEERLKKRLEARAKEEAEKKTRIEQAEQARLVEIERAKAAEVARIITEAEVKRLAEIEAKAQAEALEKAAALAIIEAREKAEAQAKADALAKIELQVKIEAAAKAEIQAELEQKARAKAAQLAQAAAEEQARLDREREAREAAEKAVRAAAEAQAREKAEKQAQEEAALLFRLQAEARAKEEEVARIKAEADAKIREAAEVVARAKTEAEAVARQEAEQKLREQAIANARAEAQAKAEAQAEEEERQQAEGRAIALAELRARELERQAKLAETYKPKKAPVKWGKPLLISLAAFLVSAVGLLHVITLNFYLPEIEKIASERMHEPVSVRTVRAALWPEPHLKLEGVVIGSLRDVQIGTVRVIPDVSSLFGDTKILTLLEGDSVSLDQDALPRMSGWLADASPNAMKLNQIIMNHVNLVVKGMSLPLFDVVFTLDKNGQLGSAEVKTSDHKLSAHILVQKDANQIVFSGKSWTTPLGLDLTFDEIHGKAVATADLLSISDIEGRLYGGSVKGSMKLTWARQWNLTGDLSVAKVNLKELTPSFSKNFSLDGGLDARTSFAFVAPVPAKLLLTPRLQATFKIENGTLGNVDLVTALQSTAKETNGGQTRFDKFSGLLLITGNQYQLKQMTMSAGLLSATGFADVAQDHSITGRISAELGTKAAMNRGKLLVSGKVGQPVLRKSN